MLPIEVDLKGEGDGSEEYDVDIVAKMTGTTKQLLKTLKCSSSIQGLL